MTWSPRPVTATVGSGVGPCIICGATEIDGECFKRHLEEMRAYLRSYALAHLEELLAHGSIITPGGFEITLAQYEPES